MYDDVLDEDVPDDFRSLLDKIDASDKAKNGAKSS